MNIWIGLEHLKAVEAKKPKVHVFGRIHGGACIFENGDNRFINAAKLNDDPTGEPTGIIRVDDP